MNAPAHRITTHRPAAVVAAFQKTFSDQSAAIVLAWALGQPLLHTFGSWPSLQLDGAMASGKSELLLQLNRLFGFKLHDEDAQTSRTEPPARTWLYRVLQAWGLLAKPPAAAFPRIWIGEDDDCPAAIGVIHVVLRRERMAGRIDSALPAFDIEAWIDWLHRASARGLAERVNDVAAKWIATSPSGLSPDQVLFYDYASLLVTWQLLREFVGWVPQDAEFEQALYAALVAHAEEAWAWQR